MDFLENKLDSVALAAIFKFIFKCHTLYVTELDTGHCIHGSGRVQFSQVGLHLVLSRLLVALNATGAKSITFEIVHRSRTLLLICPKSGIIHVGM